MHHFEVHNSMVFSILTGDVRSMKVLRGLMNEGRAGGVWESGQPYDGVLKDREIKESVQR